MTRAEEIAIVSARRAFAVAFGSRCAPELLERSLGVLKLCIERPSAAAYVTILNGAWSIVYRPVAPARYSEAGGVEVVL